MKKIVLGIFGIFLILIGIAGWILPILPGWPFIFLGLSFIAPAFAARLKRRFLRKFSKQDAVYLDNWKKNRIHAGFSTRHFPLVLHSTEELSETANQTRFEKLLAESPALLSQKVSLGPKFAYLNQMHGDKIAVLEDGAAFQKGGFYRFSDTDGILTDISGLTLLVMTADCLSIFFSAGKNEKQWIGLVHAGWRGTQKNIAKKAFQAIIERSGCSPSDIHVIFGPRIGKEEYQVGPEFKEYFPEAAQSGKSPFRSKNNKLYFDLAGENKRQLIEAGAKSDNIFDLEICTVSENDDFYSFRKENSAAGRMISFIKKY